MHAKGHLQQLDEFPAAKPMRISASEPDGTRGRRDPVYEVAGIPGRIDDRDIKAAFRDVQRWDVGNKVIADVLDWLSVNEQDPPASRFDQSRDGWHPERQHVSFPHKLK